jgi:hypothetical protein
MAEPKKYVKLPVVIEAMVWPGFAARATPIIDWILANGGTARYAEEYRRAMTPHRPDDLNVIFEPERIAIDTLEGTMTAVPGDYIIKGVQGEFYPCKPDIFAATYREMTDD